MIDPSVPIIGIGIVGPGMGGKRVPWPFGAGVRASGVRWVVTLRATGASLTDLASGSSSRLGLVLKNNTRSGQRQLENTLTSLVPLRALGLTREPQDLRLVAAAGVTDGAGWFRGSTSAVAPFDLAFVHESIQWADGTGEDEAGDWEQTRQSHVLATGDVSSAALSVSFRDRAVQTPVGQGRTRIYRPSIEMRTGEGIEPNHSLQLVNASKGTAAEQATEAPLGNYYLGLYLPYSVWTPADTLRVPGPGLPTLLTLHGITGTHQSHLFPDWVNGGFDVHAIAVALLGRSEYGFYQGAAALDVLEALLDAEAHLPIDRQRVYLTGFSMGGVGTYTLATERPDLFAAALPLAGPGTGPSGMLWPLPVKEVPIDERQYVGLQRMGSYGQELLDNALNLAFRIWHTVGDQYVAQPWSESDNALWRQLAYDYQVAKFTARTHVIVAPYVNGLYHEVVDGCSSSSSAGCSDSSLHAAANVLDPARVVFKTLPSSWAPEIGLRYDRAYWVSGMRVRTVTSSSSFGRVDATSLALAQKLRAPIEQLDPELRTFGPTGDNYLFQAIRWGASRDELSRDLLRHCRISAQ